MMVVRWTALLGLLIAVAVAGWLWLARADRVPEPTQVATSSGDPDPTTPETKSDQTQRSEPDSRAEKDAPVSTSNDPESGSRPVDPGAAELPAFELKGAAPTSGVNAFKASLVSHIANTMDAEGVRALLRTAPGAIEPRTAYLAYQLLDTCQFIPENEIDLRRMQQSASSEQPPFDHWSKAVQYYGGDLLALCRGLDRWNFPGLKLQWLEVAARSGLEPALQDYLLRASSDAQTLAMRGELDPVVRYREQAMVWLAAWLQRGDPHALQVAALVHNTGMLEPRDELRGLAYVHAFALAAPAFGDAALESMIGVDSWLTDAELIEAVALGEEICRTYTDRPCQP